MRKSAEHSRHLKRLFNQVKKDGSKASLVETDDPLRVLLIGVFSNYASEQRAANAAERILAAMVDPNELRVTPVADLIQIVGVDYPQCRPAVEELVRILHSVFNRTHDLDLTFLKSSSKKAAEAFLGSLDGLSPHAKAFFQQRYLNLGTIPLDANMHALLQRSGCIEQEANVEEAQRFLAGVFKGKDAAGIYSRFKRYAASHAQRKKAVRSAPTNTRTAKPGQKTASKGTQTSQRIKKRKSVAARKSTTNKRVRRSGKIKARRRPSRHK